MTSKVEVDNDKALERADPEKGASSVPTSVAGTAPELRKAPENGHSNPPNPSKPTEDEDQPVAASYLDIFKQFVLLGWTAFGGPAAHIGIFQKTFVDKLHWLSPSLFLELLALGQVLPGPTSTQVSFAIGVVKRGISGGLLSGALFQYPGAIIMTALGGAAYKGLAQPKGAVQGMAFGFGCAGVAMVAGAAVQLGKKICDSRVNQVLAVFSAIFAFYWPKPYVFPAVIGFGGLVTWVTERKKDVRPKATTAHTERLGMSMRLGACLIFLWAAVLAIVIPIQRSTDYSTRSIQPLWWFESFFRVGSIIYGGGQVVLPLLFDEVCQRDCGNDAVSGVYKCIDKPTTWVTTAQFLAGLGIVQALPGPLFNFAAYLGTITALRGGWPFILGAVLAWVGLFGPGILLIFGFLPFWHRFRSNVHYRRALPGLNSSAVGLIFASVMSMFLKIYTDDQLQWKQASVCIMAIIYTATEVIKIPAPIGVVAGGVLGIGAWGAKCF